jgi:uncharacterized protein (PEP-CTERM system associated)
VGATLTFTPLSELRLPLRGGRESSDVQYSTTQWSNTWGAGVDWQPTPRTQISAQGDRRYFGNSYTVTASHRMARSVWSYSNSRSVSGEPTLPGAASLLAQFNQFYDGCLSSLPHQTALCTQIVSQILGLDPNAPLGFLNSAQSLQRTQSVTAAYSGLRTTVTLSGSSSTTSRLAGVVCGEGDLSKVPEVRQILMSLTIAHRLTSVSSLAAAVSRQKVLDSGDQPGNIQTTATVGWSSTLGPRTSGSLSVRHTVADSETHPYNESAIIGSLSLRF